MKNLIKEVTFQAGGGNWVLPLGYLILSKKQFSINQLLDHYDYGCLIELKKNKQEATIIFNKTKSYWLFTFNFRGLLVNSYKFNHENSEFSSFTITEPFVTIIPVETILPIKKIVSIFIKDKNKAEPPVKPQVVILKLEKGQNILKNPFKEKFPYIIVRRMATVYEKTFIQFHFDLKPGLEAIYVNPNQLPKGISLSEVLRSRVLDEMLKKYAIDKAVKRRAEKFCLVLQEDRCIYFEKENFYEHDEPPTGGTLIIGDKMIDIQNMGKHY